MTKRQRRKQRAQLDADVPVKTEPPQGQVSIKTNWPDPEIDSAENLVCCFFNLLLQSKLSKIKLNVLQ